MFYKDYILFKFKTLILNYILNKYILHTLNESCYFHISVKFENNIRFIKQYKFDKSSNTITNYQGNTRYNSKLIGNISINNGVINGYINDIRLLINIKYEGKQILKFITDKFKNKYNEFINKDNKLHLSVDFRSGDVIATLCDKPDKYVIFN